MTTTNQPMNIHEPYLTTLTGHSLPSLAEVAQAETIAEAPQNAATVAVLANPTEENVRRYIDATVAQIAALKTAALCAMRMQPGRVRHG